MRYPEAQWLGNGQSGGSYTGGPFRLVIHTTETAGLPNYNSGWSAPHITYHPGFRAFYQHTDFDTAARALRNEAGGVETNRRSALQIEIICYSAKHIADQTISRRWVGDLPDHAYTDLQQFISWCGHEYGVKPVWPGKQALSYSQANASGFRMTGAQWNVFDGVIGHQHVPENSHWDPGAINWKKLLPEDDMPLTDTEMNQIAEKVWFFLITDPTTGTKRGAAHHLAQAYRYAHQAASKTSTVDEAALAAAVVSEMSPGLQAAVAAELKKITLKAE